MVRPTLAISLKNNFPGWEWFPPVQDLIIGHSFRLLLTEFTFSKPAMFRIECNVVRGNFLKFYRDKSINYNLNIYPSVHNISKSSIHWIVIIFSSVPSSSNTESQYFVNFSFNIQIIIFYSLDAHHIIYSSILAKFIFWF